MADRWGRTETILLWSCVSLVLSFSIGWLVNASAALPVLLAGGAKEAANPLAWGIAWATLGLGAALGRLATWKLRRRR